ncbi:hypothetical protein Ciccas_012293 [Cichlidogyrus casuarinus]|uniref:Uncharacterized protein n=1 Tax=Cichlidogyrus casuarinus TaxID=1844966 RepID=A0ABD2PPQ2_9PLAT
MRYMHAFQFLKPTFFGLEELSNFHWLCSTINVQIFWKNLLLISAVYLFRHSMNNEINTPIFDYATANMFVYPICFQIIIRSISVASEVSSSTSRLPPNFLSLVIDVLHYTFHCYTFSAGPIIMYSDWRVDALELETKKVQGNGRRTNRFISLKSLVGRACRLAFWFVVWSLVLTQLHPRSLLSLAFKTDDLKSLSPYDDAFRNKTLTIQNPIANSFLKFDALCIPICMYMEGLTFYMAYLLSYGLGRLFSDLEAFVLRLKLKSGNFNSVVPDGPRCISHIFLYTEMWRTFDRGLYNFLLM